MPSAEEILKARDEPVAAEGKIAVDYAEEQPAVDREPGEEPQPRHEPGERPQQSQPDDDDDDGERGPVPYQALKAERQKAKRYTEEVADLRRQLSDLTNAVLQQRQQPPQQPQQPEAPPEFDWDNPHLTIDQRIEQRVGQERAAIQAEFQRQREAVQSQFAMTRHGEDIVKAAYQALGAARDTDPNWMADYQTDHEEPRINTRQWSSGTSRQRFCRKSAPILNAYKAKIRAEYLEELADGTSDGRAAGGDDPRAAGDRHAVQSEFGARSVGSRNGAAWSGPRQHQGHPRQSLARGFFA